MFLTKAESAELQAFEVITGFNGFDEIATLGDLCLKAAAQYLTQKIGQQWRLGNYYPIVILAVDREKLTLDFHLLCGVEGGSIQRNYPIAAFITQHQLLRECDWKQTEVGSSRLLQQQQKAAVLDAVARRLLP